MKFEDYVIKLALDNGIIITEEIGYNTVDVTNKVVKLSGNTSGLLELANYIYNIAINPNSHLHLNETNFFDNDDFELIIKHNNK